MKKVFLYGLLVGVVMLILGMAVSNGLSALLPSLAKEYQNISLFRPWSDPLMSIFFVYPFIMGWVLAWVWNKTKSLVPGQGVWSRGAKFGLAFWVVTMIPGMVMSYSSFQISLVMVLSWSLSGLVSDLCAGLILAKLNK